MRESPAAYRWALPMPTLNWVDGDIVIIPPREASFRSSLFDSEGVADRSVAVSFRGKSCRLLTLSPMEDMYAEQICSYLHRKMGCNVVITITRYPEGLQRKVFGVDGTREVNCVREVPGMLPTLELKALPLPLLLSQ